MALLWIGSMIFAIYREDKLQHKLTWHVLFLQVAKMKVAIVNLNLCESRAPDF